MFTRMFFLVLFVGSAYCQSIAKSTQYMDTVGKALWNYQKDLLALAMSESLDCEFDQVFCIIFAGASKTLSVRATLTYYFIVSISLQDTTSEHLRFMLAIMAEQMYVMNEELDWMLNYISQSIAILKNPGLIQTLIGLKKELRDFKEKLEKSIVETGAYKLYKNDK